MYERIAVTIKGGLFIAAIIVLPSFYGIFFNLKTTAVLDMLSRTAEHKDLSSGIQPYAQGLRKRQILY